MATLLSGLVGGLVATIAMTMFMMALGVDTLTGALLWALGFAAVLTIVGMVFWMRVVLAMEPKPRGYVRAVPRRLRRRPRWESYIPPLVNYPTLLAHG